MAPGAGIPVRRARGSRQASAPTDSVGRAFPFDLLAGCLAVYAVTAWFLLRDRPGRATATGSLRSRTAAAVHTPATWQPAFLYAVSFGGFVAFSVYLPACLPGPTSSAAPTRPCGPRDSSSSRSPR